MPSEREEMKALRKRVGDIKKEKCGWTEREECCLSNAPGVIFIISGERVTFQQCFIPDFGISN